MQPGQAPVALHKLLEMVHLSLWFLCIASCLFLANGYPNRRWNPSPIPRPLLIDETDDIPPVMALRLDDLMTTYRRRNNNNNNNHNSVDSTAIELSRRGSSDDEALESLKSALERQSDVIGGLTSRLEADDKQIVELRSVICTLLQKLCDNQGSPCLPCPWKDLPTNPPPSTSGTTTAMTTATMATTTTNPTTSDPTTATTTEATTSPPATITTTEYQTTTTTPEAQTTTVVPFTTTTHSSTSMDPTTAASTTTKTVVTTLGSTTSENPSTAASTLAPSTTDAVSTTSTTGSTTTASPDTTPASTSTEATRTTLTASTTKATTITTTASTTVTTPATTTATTPATTPATTTATPATTTATPTTTAKPTPNPEAKCDDPKPPENGYIVGNETKLGSQVEIKCNAGYTLVGVPMMECTALWSDETHSFSYNWAPPMSAVCKAVAGYKVAPTLKAKSIRRKRSIVEEDQMICNQRPDTGPCRASIPRYFYNGASGMCETFIYGGCRGNNNNFRTLDECTGRCNARNGTQPVSLEWTL